MASTKIAYLLGAGASALKLPILNKLPTDMRNLKGACDQFGIRTDPGVATLIGHLDNLAEKSGGFNTVDTYAKKLYLNKDYKKLHELKVTLSFFFILRQFSNEPRGKPGLHPIIDPRYISLASAFLENQNDQIVLPENIKFLTWNYDLQLEMSLRSFCDDALNVATCLERFKVCKDLVSLTNKDQIIHLNGAAGFYLQGKETKCIVDSISTNSLEVSLGELKGLLLELYNSEDYNIMQFHFAWETRMEKINFFNKMRSALLGVEYIVVVGYSFPVFNRTFDKDIFRSLRQSGLKKVYFQSKRPDADALEAIFDLKDVKIIPVDVFDDDMPFVLPFEF